MPTADRLIELFHRARTHAVGIERDQFVAEVCRDAPDLRSQLLSLLEADQQLERAEFLRNPAVIPPAELLTEKPGDRIGPYKLLEKLGEGGCGVVYMAEQESPVRRQVAFKAIKLGMDTKEVIARFEAERQALAMMDHPNIAKVFDAGVSNTSRPYFVMELVRGIKITRYCDEHQLAMEERLKLFVQVCQAVHHAHQKGIIHRDLKPSNILVAQHDTIGVPKVIDFGIAKATTGRLTEKTLFTAFEQFIGTPAYMSPEQAQLSGLDIDTRSDIYSVGVLLYELLTGTTPFDVEKLRSSGLGLDEIRQVIREKEPPPPSTRLSTMDRAAAGIVASRRGSDPPALIRRVRGDLDWIVMKCLEKERGRRYETAYGLARDVERYLRDELVLARPPSAADRIQKFVRRNRTGVFAGSAVALSLVAGLVIASVSLLRERAARERESSLHREAEASAARARAAAAKSAQVARFMTDMLNGVGPSVALGRDTTMLRDILEGTARRLDTELRDQPDVAAELRETLGIVYRDLGRYAAAEPFLSDAVATHRKLSGNESAELAGALDHLGEVLRRLNRPNEAEAALQEALAIRRKRFGNDHPAVADTLFHLSQVPNASRASADVAKLLNEVLAIRRRAFGTEHPSIAETIAALGTLARNNFDHDKASARHAEAVAMFRKFHGNDHPAVAGALDHLGYSLVHIGRKAEATEAYRESFSLRRKLLGPQHPQMVVSLLRYIGQIPAVDADEATIGLVQEFIAGQRKTLPAGSPLLAPSLLTLAILFDRPERNPEEAVRLAGEARKLLDDSLTSGSPLDVEVINAMSLYGWWKILAADPSEGRAMGEAALKLARGAFGRTHRGVVLANRIPAWAYLGMGRFDDAIPQFEESLRVDHAMLPPGHAFMREDVAGLGAAYREAGRIADSRRVLEEMLNAEKMTSVARTMDTGTIPVLMCELGLTLNQQARYAEAESILREALRSYDLHATNLPLPRMRPRACAESALGLALAGQGKFAEAEPLVVHAFEELKANKSFYSGDARRLVRDAFDAVIVLYTAWGKPDKVAAWEAARP